MLNGCSSCLRATALVTLLLLPAHYYIPELNKENLIIEPVTADADSTWLPFDFPPHDIHISITLCLTLWALLTYLYYWIQIKLMERRLLKLNNYLHECLDRVRVWDTRQKQVEATLRMVNNATSEYNLLLYLLMQRRKLVPSSPCFDKDLDNVMTEQMPRTIDI